VTDIFGDQTATDWYLAQGGNPTPGVLALLAEVQRGRERARAPREGREDYERLHAEDKQKRERFLDACRPSTPAEYAAWLTGWLRRGGRVTHPHGYPLHGFVTMQRYATVPELYGALSLNILVPEDVPLAPANLARTFHGCSGHNGVFFMTGFQVVAQVVPSYTDVEPLIGDMS